MALEHFFTAAFLLEMICKLKVLGKAYIQDSWNILDALLVTMSIADVWIISTLIGALSSVRSSFAMGWHLDDLHRKT